MTKNVRLLLAALLSAALLLTGCGKTAEPSAETQTPPASDSETQATEDLSGVLLREALLVKEAGDYVGIYVEDGSDEAVSGILKLVVKNITAEPIQYAEITLHVGGETALFTLTALPAGGTAVLLEQSRMAYDEAIAYDLSLAECTQLAAFDRPLSLQEQALQIQCLDGALNIKNISGQDIDGTIVLCYKNFQDGVYYGGIAYRIRLEDGLKADEVRQLMVTHFHQPGSQLVYVDIV